MSFQQKNISVTLASFILILGYALLRLYQMTQGGSFNSANVFRLWGVVIVLAIVMTVVATILTHILTTILEAIRTGNEDLKVEDIADERDQLIDLRGTKVTNFVSSIGVFLAMLTFVLGQPPLVMFSLLILAGIVAQVVGDIARLYLYRRGF